MIHLRLLIRSKIKYRIEYYKFDEIINNYNSNLFTKEDLNQIYDQVALAYKNTANAPLISTDIQLLHWSLGRLRNQLDSGLTKPMWDVTR